MADETAKLVVAVDSTQAKSAAADLDKLTEASGRTAEKQREIAEALQRNRAFYAQNADQIRRQNEQMGLYRDGVNQSATALGSLIGKEEAAAAAAQKLAAAQSKAGAAAKSTAGAHSGLSLASGQAAREYAVLINEMQRGDFTRFQGSLITLGNRIGLMPMLFTAMGASIAGVIAIVAAFAIGIAKGDMDAHNFNKTVQATGDYAHTSYTEIIQMSKGMDKLGVTVGTAREALTAVAGSGRFFRSELQGISQGAVDMAAITGKSIAEAVADFTKLKDDPVRASEELDKQFHFLDETTRQQIKNFADLGQSQQATAVASQALAEHFHTAQVNIYNDMGFVQKRVYELRDAWSKLWDSVLNVGRPSSPKSQMLAAVDTMRQAQKDLTDAQRGNIGAGKDQVSGLQSEEGGRLVRERTAALAEQVRIVTQLTAKTVADSPAQRAAAAAQTEASEATKKHTAEINDQLHALDRSYRRKQEIDKITATFNEERKKDPDSQLFSLANEAKLISDVEHRYRDYKEARVSATQAEKDARREAAANKTQYEQLSKSIDEHRALVKAAGEETQRLSETERWAIKAKADLTAATNHLTAAQIAQKTAEIDQIVAMDAANQARAQEVKTTEEATRALERYVKSGQSRERNSQRALDAVGHSANWAAEQQKQYEIIDEAENARIALTDKARAAQTLETAAYKKGLVDIGKEMNAQLAREKQFYAERKAAMGDWRNGAQRAWEEFADKANDVAGQTYDSFQTAFSGMESAIDQFAKTGKFNIQDFGRTVLAELAKIELRIILSKVLTAMFGAATSGGGGGDTGAGGVYGTGSAGDSAPFAMGAAFAGGRRLTGYARGAVVTSPTLFPMATGTGLMGEAGPEGILPLKRMSGGQLGVHAAGSGGSQYNVTTTVIVQSDGSASSKTTTDENSKQAKMLGEFLSSRIKTALVEEQKQGGILWRMNNG